MGSDGGRWGGRERGRDTVTWIGCEMLHHTRKLGISERRADWLMKWTSEVAASRTVHTRSFEEGLAESCTSRVRRSVRGPSWDLGARSSPHLCTLLSSVNTSHSSCRTPDTAIAQLSCVPASCPPPCRRTGKCRSYWDRRVVPSVWSFRRDRHLLLRVVLDGDKTGRLAAGFRKGFEALFFLRWKRLPSWWL